LAVASVGAGADDTGENAAILGSGSSGAASSRRRPIYFATMAYMCQPCHMCKQPLDEAVQCHPFVEPVSCICTAAAILILPVSQPPERNPQNRNLEGTMWRPMSSVVEQCRATASSVEQCRAVSSIVEQCRAMSSNVDRCRELFSNVEQCGGG
jgi:hypothetical protein